MGRQKPELRGTVYLLHFDPAYKHAKHYIGFSTNLDERLVQHMTGRGAKLVEVVINAGHTFELARVWENVGETMEQAIKRLGGASRICPICNPATALTKATFRGGFRKAPPRWGWFRKRPGAGEEVDDGIYHGLELSVEDDGPVEAAGRVGTKMTVLIPVKPGRDGDQPFYGNLG